MKQFVFETIDNLIISSISNLHKGINSMLNYNYAFIVSKEADNTNVKLIDKLVPDELMNK